MRTIQYLLLAIVCAAGAVLMAQAISDQISASLEHSAAIIANPREAAHQ